MRCFHDTMHVCSVFSLSFSLPLNQPLCVCVIKMPKYWPIQVAKIWAFNIYLCTYYMCTYKCCIVGEDVQLKDWEKMESGWTDACTIRWLFFHKIEWLWAMGMLVWCQLCTDVRSLMLWSHAIKKTMTTSSMCLSIATIGFHLAKNENSKRSQSEHRI